MRILVIEDDTKTAEFLLQALSDAGYETSYADNGVSGLETALKEDFDCAVVDIMLPQMDGFTVIEKHIKNRIFY